MDTLAMQPRRKDAGVLGKHRYLALIAILVVASTVGTTSLNGDQERSSARSRDTSASAATVVGNDEATTTVPWAGLPNGSLLPATAGLACVMLAVAVILRRSLGRLQWSFGV